MVAQTGSSQPAVQAGPSQPFTVAGPSGQPAVEMEAGAWGAASQEGRGAAHQLGAAFRCSRGTRPSTLRPGYDAFPPRRPRAAEAWQSLPAGLGQHP